MTKMRTIPDSNVLLDLLRGGSPWEVWSKRQLHEAEGLVVNQIVYAEAAGEVREQHALDDFLAHIDCEKEDVPWAAAYLAGHAHRSYRRTGGTRERVLPDFLIGAHAAVKGYRVITRDVARYRTYFPAVEVIAPDTHP